MSVQLHSSAVLTPVKELLASTGWEAEWVLGSARTLWRRDKFFCHYWESKPVHPARIMSHPGQLDFYFCQNENETYVVFASSCSI
jgi:hypothetical protein